MRKTGTYWYSNFKRKQSIPCNGLKSLSSGFRFGGGIGLFPGFLRFSILFPLDMFLSGVSSQY